MRTRKKFVQASALIRSAGLALALALLLAPRPASAAAEGQLCGRVIGRSIACDEGLECDLRLRIGPIRIGLCTAAQQICGGLMGAACEAGAFCDFPLEASCGAADQTGSCEPIPEVCTREYRPVCGCDDRTYANPCSAHAAGISIASYDACGECTEDTDCLHGYCDRGVSCAGVDCPPPPPNRCTVCGDGSQLLCRRAALPCPEGQVREIVNSCYGVCVDRYSCEPRSACDDPGRRYASRDVEECTRIDLNCQAGEQPFTDGCGCGCASPG